MLFIALVGLILRVWASSSTWLHFDENYYINIAQNYVDRGGLTPYMWRLGDVNIVAGGGSGFGILLLVQWLHLVKYSLVAGRLLMVLCGFLSAVIMYRVAYRFWDSRLAGAAAFTYAVAGTHPFYSMILKMDAVAILGYCLVLLLHVYSFQSKKWWLHFLLGLAVVLTTEFHILGLLYLGALGFYYAAVVVKSSLLNKRLMIDCNTIGFAAGGLIAGTVYLIIHVFPDPNAYFFISNTCFECHDGIIQAEIKRLVRLIVFRPQEVVILLLVVISAFSRRKQVDNHYLILLLGWFVAQAVIQPPPFEHYEVHIWPLVALGIGGFIAKGFRGLQNAVIIRAGAITACFLLALNFWLYLSGTIPFQLQYKPMTGNSIEFIQNEVPKDAVVLSKVGNFYPLKDFRNFISYQDGSGYGIMLRHETFLDLWEREKPQVILLNENEVEKDDQLIKYMAGERFVHVLSDLWVVENLLQGKEAK